MFSLNSFQHGASTLGADLGKEKFEGTRNAEEIERFKDTILALARLHHVEKFLFQPIEELVPLRKNYKDDDPAEERQFVKDTDKVLETAAKAYALVKSQFKPNSQASAVIQPAEETGRLDVLWKLFVTHYDNPGTKAGAERLIQAYYEKPKNIEIINLFIHYTEHFNKVDAVQNLIGQPLHGTSIVDLLTPRKMQFPTPAAATASTESSGSTLSAGGAKQAQKGTFPQWARVLHALHRIKNEVSKYSKLISKFLYEYIGRAENQDLEDLTVEKTLEHLKAFVLIFKEEDLPISALQANTSFFCKMHGNNSSHSTKDCRKLNYD